MKPTVEYIQRKFEEFNRLIFNNDLKPLPIHVSHAKSTLGGVTFKHRHKWLGKEEYYDFAMRISTRFDLPEPEIEDIIIHEMIHYYILSHQMRDTSPHGQLFKQMMNDINQRHKRHITISRRSSPTEQNLDQQARLHYLCVAELPDGRTTVMVSARTKVFYMWRTIPQLFTVKSITWYVSTDPYFNRFPNAIKPRLFLVDRDEITDHLKTARELVNDGKCIMAKRKEQ